MSKKHVRARNPIVVTHIPTGQQEAFFAGKEVDADSVWATDPQYAWLFEDPDDAPVEQATAAPGEKRTVKKKKSGK